MPIIELSLTEAKKRLKTRCERAGLRKTAGELELSPGYLCEILKGTRSFGRKAQDALQWKIK